MDDLRDYYAILGLERGASQESIRRAFRTRLLEAHPDKTAQPTDPERLRFVIESFDVLSNPESRERYDRVHEPGLQEVPFPSYQRSCCLGIYI